MCTLILLVSTSIVATPSIVDTLVYTLPSIAPILRNISVLDLVSISIQSLYPISSFTTSPSTSTIVSIPKVKPAVETKQPLKLLLASKEIEEDIDLDTEIEIPKIDFNTSTIEEMMMISQLLEKKAKKKQLRSERDKEYTIIENARNIIVEATCVEVDSTQHILLQLEEVVQKFNEYSSRQENLIKKVEKKSDNKVLKHISQQIAIK